MKLKVCGMRYQDNIKAVAKLQPDYLGFIFYEKSARYFNSSIPELPSSIKKVGVFVNAKFEEILEKVERHNLQAVQLHGNESAEFCKLLKHLFEERSPNSIEIIKVFSIKNEFDFSVLKAFETVCDYFLFDTKGKLPGGNGFTFNWEVLNDYPSTKPYFLSGGVGLNEVEKIKEFKKNPASNYCFAIDVNSKFEIEAGIKNVEKLKQFKTSMS